MICDLRIALRRLYKSPLFTLTTVMILAIGIGAVTAIFSVVHAVLIRPLPYPDSERLVGVWHAAPGIGPDLLAHAHISYLFYRQHQRVFEDMGIFLSDTANLAGGDRPIELPVARISASLLTVLGVPPQLGRGFREEETRPSADPTVVLSHRLWQDRFGGDRQIVGRPVRIDGVARTVIGVMPRGFRFPDARTWLWLPLEIDPVEPERGRWGYHAIARLRPGVDLATAETEMAAVVSRLSDAFPDPEAAARSLANMRMTARLHAYRDDVVGEVTRVLWVLLGSVGLILIIACANVANLYLVHAESQQREMAVRSALGAGRGVLARGHFVESVILAIVGGGLGLGLAAWATPLLVSLAPAGIPRLEEVGIDGSVLAFALGISLLSCLLFGTAAVLRQPRDLTRALKQAAHQMTEGRDRQLARKSLATAQLALALVLMVGSGLLLRSFIALRNVDPGCDSEAVLTLRLPLSASDYPGGAETAAFYLEALELIRALPGVQASGAATGLPVAGGGILLGHTFEDFPLADDEFVPNYLTQLVVPGYFKALGIAVLEGRRFVRSDVEQPSRDVLISGALARRLWPGESPLGKRVTPGRPEMTGVWYTIAGVVDDARFEGLERRPSEVIYYPLAPLPPIGSEEGLFVRGLYLAVRTHVPPASVARAVSTAIWSIDPHLPVTDVLPMEEVVRRGAARTAFTALLLLIAAASSLALGATGLFAVMSCLFSRRTHEIGVRMALGADRRSIIWMVVSQGLALGLVGVALGLAGALAMSRLLGSLLFGVRAVDPLTLAAVSALLVVVTAAASLLPALRAAATEPWRALKCE